MSTKDKLLDRFKRLPKDFTFDELIRLMGLFDYQMDNKGMTSGSRVSFSREGRVFDIHRPHPGKIVKRSTLKQLHRYLKENNLL
ncbi:MAG: type II toxin-antitoxin system HicA family toxin [Bacteroidales bacterium]|nr:type II toxin-antitoxin system HicA family toxin [Bacteroidales bacterium]